MPGSIRALRRRVDPIRGGGRLPLVKRRTAGRPQFREAGSDTLSAQEEAIADAVEQAVLAVPSQTVLDSLESRDYAGYGRAVLNALTDASGAIQDALLDAFVSSGETSAIDLGRELATQYRRVGKADGPSPSEVALRFRFDKTDPRATEWARTESSRLITNMARSEQEVFRALVGQTFDEARTPGSSASLIYQQLRTVTPSPTAAQFASTLGTNLNGLTTRYERAVVNRVADRAGDLYARGITGTKALEDLQKTGDKYATKLRRTRSRTIARTERMMAHNQARLLSYQQAIDTGLMSREYSRKVWSTGPFDVCPICVGMAGVEAKVADPFTLPNGTQVQAPPAHPNCRCTLQTRTNTNLYEPPSLLGSNQPGDPFRFGGRGFTPEGQQFAGRPIPGATPVAAPVEEPEIIELPPPPAPTPQVTPVRGPALRDDLDPIRKLSGSDTAPMVTRPTEEVWEAWAPYRERYFRYDLDDALPREQRRAAIDEMFAIENEFLDDPVVERWAEEMAEGFKKHGGSDDRRAAYEARQQARRFVMDQQRLSDTFTTKHKSALPRWRELSGLSDDEIQAFVERRTPELLLEFIAEAKVSVQIQPRDLASVLNQGRFKNQFEVNRSRGLKDIEVRWKEEYRQFGVLAEAPAELKPIYGHLQRPDIYNVSVDQYGSARVILKDSVRERTSYTMGDSLGGVSPAHRLDAPDLDDVTLSYGWPPQIGGQYVETQIHGGVTVDDIAEVIFDTSSELYKPPSKALLNKLDKNNIPYRFVEHGESREPFTAVEIPLA